MPKYPLSGDLGMRPCPALHVSFVDISGGATAWATRSRGPGQWSQAAARLARQVRTSWRVARVAGVVPQDGQRTETSPASWSIATLRAHWQVRHQRVPVTTMT